MFIKMKCGLFATLVDSPIASIEYYSSMEAIKDFVDSCSDWLLGNIQTQVIKIMFPIVLGFQIANWWNIAPVFSVYSDAMDKVWWVDFTFTGIALVNYAWRKPEEFVEHVRKCLQRFLRH